MLASQRREVGVRLERAWILDHQRAGIRDRSRIIGRLIERIGAVGIDIEGDVLTDR